MQTDNEKKTKKSFLRFLPALAFVLGGAVWSALAATKEQAQQGGKLVGIGILLAVLVPVLDKLVARNGKK